jgi:hypothetical protein
MANPMQPDMSVRDSASMVIEPIEVNPGLVYPGGVKP